MLQYSLSLLFAFVFLNLSTSQGQSILKMRIKASKDFRMQIFYTGPEITKKWSEKYTVFRRIKASNVVEELSIPIKTNEEINNIRIDLGEVSENEIEFHDLTLFNNNKSFQWSGYEIYQEYYINDFLINKINKQDSSIVLFTLDRANARITDPYIHLNFENNRIINEGLPFHVINIGLKANQSNRISGNFRFSDGEKITITKNYFKSNDNISFLIYNESNLIKSSFTLGQNYDSRFAISYFKYDAPDYSRLLIGSEINKYFNFNFCTELSGNDTLFVVTKVYDGIYSPGFISSKPLISRKEEISILTLKSVLIIFSAILFYFVNKKIFLSPSTRLNNILRKVS